MFNTKEHEDESHKAFVDTDMQVPADQVDQVVAPVGQQASSGTRRLVWVAGPWATLSWRAVLMGLAVGIALPWLLLTLAGNSFLVQLSISFLVFAIVAECWNLVLGVAGVFSLAQLALYAVGGYTTAMLVIYLHWNPWVSILMAPVMAALAALIVGLPILRLRGVYVALLTLGIQELLANFLATGPDIFGHAFGLRVRGMGFPDWLGSDQLMLYYYFGLILFGITTLAVWWVMHSPIGMAARAMRDSEVYAVSRGINIVQVKLFIFAFSAFFTGLAGAFMTQYQGLVSSTILSFDTLVALVTMIVLGGWGTFWGPIAGAALYVILNDWLLQPLGPGFQGLAFGLLLAMIVVLAPTGLVGTVGKWAVGFFHVFRESE